MSIAFWITLTLGILATIVHTYLSHNHDKKKGHKRRNTVNVLIPILEITSTITLAIVANFIFDRIIDQNTNSSIDESVPKVEINNGNNNAFVQGNGNMLIQGDGNNIRIDDIQIVDDSETLLYQRLKDTVTDEILCFMSDDFDNDGRKEAFAFVGHLSDSGENATWNGIPYFVNNKIIQKLSSNTRYGYNVDNDYYVKGCREIEMGKNKAVVFTLYYTSRTVDEIYGVKNGDLKQYIIPDVQGKLQVTENFITLLVDSFDALWEENSNNRCGHTWKSYYFFWNDGTNNFSEYGGVNISLEQLYNLKEVSSLINEYENNGYRVYNILYRANGIININFEKIETPEITHSGNKIAINHLYKNVTLHVKHEVRTLNPDEILERNSGIYLTAINPKIAVYPEFPY